MNDYISKTSKIESKIAAPNSKDYNLGSGMISKGDTIYSVGVSNQLQVPYHGQFGQLVSSIDNLPTDFILNILNNLNKKININIYFGNPKDIFLNILL